MEVVDYYKELANNLRSLISITGSDHDISIIKIAATSIEQLSEGSHHLQSEILRLRKLLNKKENTVNLKANDGYIRIKASDLR